MLSREIRSDLAAMSTDEIRFRVGILRSNGASRLADRVEKWIVKHRTARAVSPLTDAPKEQ